MTVRTTSAAVALLIEIDDDISLTSFIETANALVTECCSTDDYDATRLELIERWLSAHVYTIRDMRASEERVGTVSERKQSMVGLGFDTSHYGQMAMRLDTKGGLAALNAQMKKGTGQAVQISWLGDDDYNP